MGEPVVPIEGGKGDDLAAPTIAQPATVEPSSAIAPEVTAKPTKRGSVFGSLFGKKDGVSPSLERKDKDIVPAVPANDGETVPLATTAPQLDPVAISAPSVEGATTEPETAATFPVIKATSPGESKGGVFGFLKQKEAQKEVRIFWLDQRPALIVDRRKKKRRKRSRRKRALTQKRKSPQLLQKLRLLSEAAFHRQQ